MNIENPNEIWQVEVGGQVYEAPLAELPEWIGEGSLQPGDKVRKGNLRWIEAQKVPALIPFFNARAKGEPMPFVQTVTDASLPREAEPPPAQAEPETVEEPQQAMPAEPAPRSPGNAPPIPGQCARHSDRASTFVCTGCGIELCKGCPTSYGGSVRICTDCGSMCRSTVEVSQQAKKEAVRSGIGGSAFGFEDFARAVSHPFRFKASLLFGGLMFMFFSLGRSSAWIGGIFLIASALICGMLVNMMVFGIRANVIDNFTQGRLDADFMPGFEDFSLWDDVVHPFFLSIGVYISSFGAFFIVAVIGFYLIYNAANEQMQKFNEQLTSVPGTTVYSPDRTAEQSKEVRELLGKVKQQNERRIENQQLQTEAAETGSAPAVQAPAGDPTEEDMDRLLQEIRTKRLAESSPIAQDNADAGYAAAISSILRLAAPLVVLGMITLVWGFFYYPAACAVAGYTRSFFATINPLVGLDTIRRLGVDYVKILLMSLLLLLLTGVVTSALNVVLSPFDLPRVGNIPAAVIGSLLGFYVSIVFSCILGLALFKAADRLKLSR